MRIGYKLTFFLAVLLGASGAYSQDSSFVITAVDETGQSIPGLKPDDIRIKTKSGPLQPSTLTFVPDSGLNILIMIDASVSQERVLPLGKQIASTLIDRLLKPGRDRVGVAQFTGGVELVHDLSEDFQIVKSKLDGIQFQPPLGVGGASIVITTSPAPPKKPSAWSHAGNVVDL